MNEKDTLRKRVYLNRPGGQPDDGIRDVTRDIYFKRIYFCLRATHRRVHVHFFPRTVLYCPLNFLLRIFLSR